MKINTTIWKAGKENPVNVRAQEEIEVVALEPADSDLWDMDVQVENVPLAPTAGWTSDYPCG